VWQVAKHTTLAAGDIAANKQVLMTYDVRTGRRQPLEMRRAAADGSGAMTNITGAVTVSGCTVTSGVWWLELRVLRSP